MYDKDKPTPEQIAKHYTALGHSVDVINEILSDPSLHFDPEESIKRNVDHLVQMLAQDFWTSEDMTSVNSAIAAGNSYLSA
tara:strand:+ start:1084 stop:1326 length:243 start_codon:yes stop_codon:yes gene_type:complete